MLLKLGSELFEEQASNLFYKCGSKMWHLPLLPPEILLGINVSLHFPEGKGCLIGFALSLMWLLEEIA